MRRTRVASGNDLLSSVPRLEKSQSYLLESYYATQRTGLRSLSPFFDLRKLKRKEKKERKKEEKSHRYPSALNQRQPVAILQKIIGGEET